VQNGSCRVGDIIAAGSSFGKIRRMLDDMGRPVEEAPPSMAVQVLGLNEVPVAGDMFQSFETEPEAREVAEIKKAEQRQARLGELQAGTVVTLAGLSGDVKTQGGAASGSQTADSEDRQRLNIILKTDTQGAAAAVKNALSELPQETIYLRFLLAAVGEVTEADVDLAAASGAVILAFNTSVNGSAAAQAERMGVDVRKYRVVYELVDEIRAAMEGVLGEVDILEEVGRAKVLASFGKSGGGKVAGCEVLEGKLQVGAVIKQMRGKEEVAKSMIDQLRRNRDQVKEIAEGSECGVSVRDIDDWKVDDLLICYAVKSQQRSLEGTELVGTEIAEPGLVR